MSPGKRPASPAKLTASHHASSYAERARILALEDANVDPVKAKAQPDTKLAKQNAAATLFESQTQPVIAGRVGRITADAVAFRFIYGAGTHTHYTPSRQRMGAWATRCARRR